MKINKQGRISRLSAVCLLLLLLINAKSKAQSPGPLDKPVTITISNEPLKQALDKITAVSGIKFTYNETVAKSAVKISIHAQDQPLRQLLGNALAPYPFSFTVLDQEVLIKYDAGKTIQRAATSQSKYTLSGTITNKANGETLIGATIRSGANGTATNAYGFYSLTLPKGSQELSVSAVGQKTKTITLDLTADQKLDIALEDNTQELQTVTISAPSRGGRDLRGTQMGVEKLSIKEIKDIPVLLGERDVVKTLQLLPGIQSAGEGSGGFYVRGGAVDQNLLLLDEATVYNASHLLGFFSTFNSDAIKNVSIYKGDMPARYGGRLSSVMDVQMNDGNNQGTHVSGGVGLIAARLNVEGPIQKDKSSFLISARRTYADVFLKLSRDTDINRSQLYFYDLNAKANYVLGSKDRIYLSGYFGKDVLAADKVNGINWGNTTGTLRWNHVFNNQLFSNTSLIYSNYDYTISLRQDVNDYTIYSRIRDWNLKEDLQWFPGDAHTVNFGFNSVYHSIKPGQITASGNAGISSQELPNRFSLDQAVYAGDNWKLTDRFTFSYGLRLSAFSIIKEQIKTTYFNAEPRLGAAFQLDEQSALKAAYSRNAQNLHLISNSSSGSPVDKWVASTSIIRPELADQVSLGYYRDLSEHHYELTLETYYKKLQNQIDYRNGANIFTNQPIETQLLYGKGRAYGLELLLKKKTGRLTGWLSYTLSKTQRQIDGINQDDWYNARQDRTHNLSLVGIYKLSDRWVLSANFVYYTGDAVTFPAGKYQVDGSTYYNYTSRNASRMPAYHRLDLGATKQLKKTNKFSSELSFSLYNAYGNPNAYRIYFRDNKTDPSRTEAVRTTLFTFVPAISYNFKF
ncbi:outer membrane receptor for ferrienterochelin and colicin [Mucilaginibacter gracilis]|uniref:Outer membrane receptor for ferrienterochelin and colicin n=1 Tax=Mucilaginibacter gracilis TaxID=423350 RepID=A0A495IZH5_9SPHI|nr:TonB-dependent receptor [Mucilaginibacter gracilis]RKR82116.1 outer membrane receptor for ferrienterochelin and colicin [Mucilaginibacter gracilis]